ncbi:2-oxoglutarate and iron-dependent oxygenase domain-containing protein [Roseofilum casamattae]|uniref:2-oxoglutarate and iron-dependent oxygenase domain-containing protein n=1 Tax=Roseofilum casamattae BLCC-M143 TaxID=3022442 RepID=A0ABT7BW41_9CYAN|nr:2-oxoglutarate and iron-dependent oxygenase domain-containing protein [Roseofilum casamattae]MDJ1183391.1 2-oxoglutarate and iron-dependent oxygenase domain-containing protein [Roseofilum casamattae BLCC-M143]
MDSLPIISLQKLAIEDAREIEQLDRACDRYGFFYLSDSSIATELIEETIIVPSLLKGIALALGLEATEFDRYKEAQSNPSYNF